MGADRDMCSIFGKRGSSFAYDDKFAFEIQYRQHFAH